MFYYNIVDNITKEKPTVILKALIRKSFMIHFDTLKFFHSFKNKISIYACYYGSYIYTLLNKKQFAELNISFVVKF